MPDRSRLHEHRQSLRPRPLAADVDLARVGAYHGYTELVTRWLAAAEAGARVHQLGHSSRGVPMFALELGPAQASATSVIMAGIHPIEWIGVEVLLGLLDRLCQQPPTDRRVLVFPLINADGYQQVEADLRAGRRRWHRTNARGVDLNRNWPVPFPGRQSPGRFGLGRRRGSHPLSEPETAIMAALLDEVHASSAIDVAVSLHSIGRMILLPYGCRWRAPAQAGRLRQVATAVRQRMLRAYTVRQVSHWIPGLFARGLEIDFLHHRYGATALLVECSMGGFRLRDPASWLHPFRWYNPPEPAAEVEAVCAGLEPLVRGQLGTPDMPGTPGMADASAISATSAPSGS